jgi:hypothetical protein
LLGTGATFQFALQFNAKTAAEVTRVVPILLSENEVVQPFEAMEELLLWFHLHEGESWDSSKVEGEHTPKTYLNMRKKAQDEGLIEPFDDAKIMRLTGKGRARIRQFLPMEPS